MFSATYLEVLLMLTFGVSSAAESGKCPPTETCEVRYFSEFFHDNKNVVKSFDSTEKSHNTYWTSDKSSWYFTIERCCYFHSSAKLQSVKFNVNEYVFLIGEATCLTVHC